MNSLEIGSTVRIREDQCIDREDRLARGVILDSVGDKHQIWWDDGFESTWFLTDDLELANDFELSLPQFADA